MENKEVEIQDAGTFAPPETRELFSFVVDYGGGYWSSAGILYPTAEAAIDGSRGYGGERYVFFKVIVPM